MKKFSFTLIGDPKKKMQEAKNIAKKHGAKVIGDESKGRVIADGVEGTYSCSGKKVNIVINKKPWYAPWFMVQGELDKFFA